MPTITIDAVEYEVYGSLADADTYFAAASHADAWRSAVQIDKERALITSTRTLDRQVWPGEKTDADQDLAWPRTNTGIDGVEDDTVPSAIVTGSFELALSILQGSTVQDATTTADLTRRMKAGSVELEYFRGADASAARFPVIVQELIGPYLSSNTSGMAGGFVSGVDGDTAFRDPCWRDPLLGDCC